MHKYDPTKISHTNHSPDMYEFQAITYKYKPSLLVTWTENVQANNTCNHFHTIYNAAAH